MQATTMTSQMLLDASYTQIYTQDGFYYHLTASQQRRIVIGDLRNAQKRGKTCTLYTIVSPYSGSENAALDLMGSFPNLKTFYDAIHAQNITEDQEITINEITVNIYCTVKKGIHTFSPYATVSPLKTAPKTWTKDHVCRALFNGQFSDLRRDGKYTDDYAFDAATDFGKKPLNALVFVEHLITSDGWSVNASNGRVRVNCHHFEFNSFIPKIAA